MISRISAEIFRFCPLLRNESHDLTFMNVPPPLGLLFRGGCGMLGKVWVAANSPPPVLGQNVGSCLVTGDPAFYLFSRSRSFSQNSWIVSHS